ncbi:n-acetylglutamate synthase [Fibrivirga algicola]|uniref:N-acetylglutamate synthase n=1 Tax=Fibrivirga algicola TaxID=2950420 RepID=A0ABX0QAM5_9BACT|nr:n-acetylglutamate synthase [Fibrivirga algicola]ARK13114.1 n-acetylglutamate synthase [Fibrella sp. ES10-3-2-2]NID09305.1 n-acetylglutamate synthase [Fibrivirga algicola]
MNYNNKIFRAVRNTANGETSTATIFYYEQTGNILTGKYCGGRIVTGQLLGLVGEDGQLDFRYQQINTDGQLMTGCCQSTPEVLPTGKIRLHETWRWTSGDESSGTSTVDEI